MSKLTEIMKLFCYDPETDGANTFNIPKALNENWEKIDQLVLLAVAAAAAYDPAGSYTVGDYCTHGGKLHKCGTTIPDGEAWNAEHWTETTVTAELAEIRASLSNKLNASNFIPIKGDTDLHTLNAGVYIVRSGANVSVEKNWPYTGWFLGFVVVFRHDNIFPNDHGSIICINESTNNVYRQTHAYETWSEWKEESTATPPQEYEIPFRDGWESGAYKSTYCKTQDGICLVNCSVYGTGVASVNFIATLPTGFRPSATVCCAAHSYKNGIRGISETEILANGDIVVFSPIEFDYVSFSFVFVAEN